MAITPLSFTPADGWANTTSFPTNPSTESQARAMLQELPDQIQTFVNALITTLAGTGGAAEVGVDTITGLTSESVATVQAALAALYAKFANYVAASIIEQTITDDPNKIPSSAAVVDAMVTGGLGDMLTSVYATNEETGKVDTAINAEKLANVDAADYATKTYVDDSVPTVPTSVSELTNDSNYQTPSGGVAEWNGTNGTNYILYGVCTQEQYDADSANPNRARTVYWIPIT